MALKVRESRTPGPQDLNTPNIPTRGLGPRGSFFQTDSSFLFFVRGLKGPQWAPTGHTCALAGKALSWG